MKNFFSILILSLVWLFVPTAHAQQQPPDDDPRPVTTDVKLRAGAAKLTPAQLDSVRAVEKAKVQAQLDAQDAADLKAPPPTTVQVSNDVTVDYNDPKTFYQEGLIGAIQAGIVALLALLGGFIPGLRNVQSKWIRSGIVIAVSLSGIATFKAAAFDQDLFNLLFATFLPNFGGVNFVYATFKNLILPFILRATK